MSNAVVGCCFVLTLSLSLSLKISFFPPVYRCSSLHWHGDKNGPQLPGQITKALCSGKVCSNRNPYKNYYKEGFFPCRQWLVSLFDLGPSMPSFWCTYASWWARPWCAQRSSTCGRVSRARTSPGTTRRPRARRTPTWWVTRVRPSTPPRGPGRGSGQDGDQSILDKGRGGFCGHSTGNHWKSFNRWLLANTPTIIRRIKKKK